MTRGECTERIGIIAMIDTVDADVSNTTQIVGLSAPAWAKVEVINGIKAAQMGLNPLTTSITVSTFSSVKSTDNIMWRGIRYVISSINPRYERFGTYYELTCTTLDA